MGELKIQQVPAHPKNYAKAVAPRKIAYIIIHTMQGTLTGTNAWFSDPAAQASAHYGIGKTGQIVQYVRDNDIAYHAGNAAYNRTSIGVELEGFMEKNPFTKDMLDALIGLCKQLITTHGVKVENIIGHCDVPNPKDPNKKGGLHGHMDPGPTFPWSSLRVQLSGSQPA